MCGSTRVNFNEEEANAQRSTPNAEVPDSWKRKSESGIQESRKGISEIEGKAARVAVSERGKRTSFNQEGIER